MNFICTEVFWGTFLIIFGFSIIIKAYTGIDIPVFRSFLALGLIYLGVSLMTNNSSSPQDVQNITFKEKRIKAENQSVSSQYSVLCGNADIDFTALSSEHQRPIRINTVCGKTILKINPETPMKINIHTLFGNAQIPQNNDVTMGNFTYLTDPNQPNPDIVIDANVVFGSLEIRKECA